MKDLRRVKLNYLSAECRDNADKYDDLTVVNGYTWD
jgi:hypothetical protein